jgi:hypothetical protein
MSDVEFCDVPSAEGFCAGNDGSLWTRWRREEGRGTGGKFVLTDAWEPAVKRPYVPERGTRVQNYELICETFNGPKPDPSLICCHRDDDHSNNTPSNLYWGTKKQNTEDAIRNGKFFVALKGPDNPLSIWTHEVRDRIRELYESGKYKRSKLAKMFTCEYHNIYRLTKDIKING